VRAVVSLQGEEARNGEEVPWYSEERMVWEVWGCGGRGG